MEKSNVKKSKAGYLKTSKAPYQIGEVIERYAVTNIDIIVNELKDTFTLTQIAAGLEKLLNDGFVENNGNIYQTTDKFKAILEKNGSSKDKSIEKRLEELEKRVTALEQRQ